MARNTWGKAPYQIIEANGGTRIVTLQGRLRWALEELRKAGAKGCAPVTHPAPRWSAYIHKLRELGVEIETLTENHGGEFAGWHGRYVLRCRILPMGKGAGKCCY